MRHKYRDELVELFGTSFKTSLGYCSAIFNCDLELVKFYLPTSQLRARKYINKIPQKKMKLFENKVKNFFKNGIYDFKDIKISLESETPFRRKVYEALRKVESGSSVTYGELAAIAGSPFGARAVGTAVARNPMPLIIPCHRVLPASGQIGRFSADGGVPMKRKMLEVEGVIAKE